VTTIWKQWLVCLCICMYVQRCIFPAPVLLTDAHCDKNMDLNPQESVGYWKAHRARKVDHRVCGPETGVAAHSVSAEGVLHCVATCCNVLLHVAVCCSALQCVAVCCSV